MCGGRNTNPFDKLAQRYDRWFDSTRGRAIFEAEVVCLRELIPDRAGRWLEIGVGTGRFVEALGIAVDGGNPMSCSHTDWSQRLSKGSIGGKPWNATKQSINQLRYVPSV